MGVVKKEEICMEVFFFLEFLHITGTFGEVYVVETNAQRENVNKYSERRIPMEGKDLSIAGSK